MTSPGDIGGGSARRDYSGRVDAATRRMMRAQEANSQSSMIDALTVSVNAERAARVYADTQEGQARIAGDQAEAQARSDADAKLAGDIAKLPRKYAQDIGNGVLTSFTITHGLGTTDIVVACYAKSNLALVTPATVTVIDANRVRLTFLLAVANNGNRVVVIG